MEIVIIILAIALVALSTLFGIMLYHQMLLTNNINQRLVLLTKDAVERTNIQNDEMLAVQEELSRVRNETSETRSNNAADIPTVEESFDPHGFDISSLEGST